jgi:hypothetical protein
MHLVACVSTNICRSLRTQQMSIVKTHPTTAFTFVRTEATDPLTYTVTAFEKFFVLQTT